MANIRYPAKIHKNSELVNVGDPVDALKYTKKVNNPSQIDLVSSWKTDDSFGKSSGDLGGLQKADRNPAKARTRWKVCLTHISSM